MNTPKEVRAQLLSASFGPPRRDLIFVHFFSVAASQEKSSCSYTTVPGVSYV